MGDDGDSDSDGIADMFDGEDARFEHCDVPPTAAEIAAKQAAEAWAEIVRLKVEGGGDPENKLWILCALTKPNGLKQALLNFQYRLSIHKIQRWWVEDLFVAVLCALGLASDKPSRAQIAWFGEACLEDIVKIKGRVNKVFSEDYPGDYGCWGKMVGDKFLEDIRFENWKEHDDTDNIFEAGLATVE
jgi:hypothetical protein